MDDHERVVSVPEFDGKFCSFNIISNELECFIVIHIIFSIVVIISTSICVITKISHSIARFKHDFVSYEGLRLWVPCKAHASTPNEFWVRSTVWAILYASREKTAMTLIHVSAHFSEDSETCVVVLKGFSKSSILRTIIYEKAFSTKDPGSRLHIIMKSKWGVKSRVDSRARWSKRTAVGQGGLSKRCSAIMVIKNWMVKPLRPHAVLKLDRPHQVEWPSTLTQKIVHYR